MHCGNTGAHLGHGRHASLEPSPLAPTFSHSFRHSANTAGTLNLKGTALLAAAARVRSTALRSLSTRSRLLRARLRSTRAGTRYLLSTVLFSVWRVLSDVGRRQPAPCSRDRGPSHRRESARARKPALPPRSCPQPTDAPLGGTRCRRVRQQTMLPTCLRDMTDAFISRKGRRVEQ